MDANLRNRDALWCQALAATLDTTQIEAVTREFNRLRAESEKPIKPHPLTCECPSIRGIKYHVYTCSVGFYERMGFVLKP